MSDYNPKAKAGYTKTGKSLKAVRRYYALKNADRQRSPRKSREDADATSRSKKTSPTDDKLSKRIAAELKVQANANEKRSQRSPTKDSTSNSTNVAPPIIMSPKDSGPVFIAETPTKSLKSIKSIKSTKSLKSQRSVGTLGQFMDFYGTGVEYGPLTLGCVVASMVIGGVYILNWLLMMIFDSMREKDATTKKHEGLPVALYLAIVSMFVILDSIYWLMYRCRFKHAIISLSIMVIATFCVGGYIVYASVTKTSEQRRLPESNNIFNMTNTRAARDNLIFVLAITYFILLVTTTGMFVKQVTSLLSSHSDGKSKEKTVDIPHMSQFLSPQ